MYAPYNAVTGNPYQGGNVAKLLEGALKLNVLHEPRWCTFLQAKQLGGKVKKGSKGIKLVWAKPDERTKEERIQDLQTGEHSHKEKEKAVKGFTVFNFSQIEWSK